MAVAVSIATTAAQDTFLATLLVQINSQRQAAGQAVYADVNAWCTDILTTQLQSWVQGERDRRAAVVGAAFTAAAPAVKQQVLTALGIAGF